MVEMSTKGVKRRGNAISTMSKKHQNLLPKNIATQIITKHGFPIRPDAQIVALPAHWA